MKRLALAGVVITLSALVLHGGPSASGRSVVPRASAAAADPFVGIWTSLDTRDSSNQHMTVARANGGAYAIALFDDLASSCGGGSATGKGSGTRAGDTVSGTVTITCANGQVIPTAPFTLTYQRATDTLVDGLGVVWSRVKASVTGSPLSLGRLVLTAAEAPGLKKRQARLSAARTALAKALRPKRLPRFAAKQTQVARFARGASEVTSIAFVFRNTATAKAAASAIAKAGRAARLKVGAAGYRLRRKETAVVWFRGRILSAIALEMSQKPAVRSAVALHYAYVADARVKRSLARTALDSVTARVSRKGELTRKGALDLFALAFKPLPGTTRPAGPAGPILDGTAAVRNVLRLWGTLTPAQRSAAAKLIGVNGVFLPTLRWTAGRTRGADYGDPYFTPDAAMTEEAKQFAAVYQQKTGVQLKLDIVAGPGSPEPGAAAYAVPIDDQGNYTATPTVCRITMAPPGLEQDAIGQSRIIAHETFHCMQFAMVGATSWTAGKFGDWVGQGTADWAAFRVTGVPWKYAYSFKYYLDTCSTRPLYSRILNDAVGFFGHTDDSVEDFWKRAEPVVVLGFKYGSGAAYDAARGNESTFLDTWASSALIAPKFGLAWTSSSPLQPVIGAGCPTYGIIGDAPVESIPLAVRLYYIEDVIEVNRPLLHVVIERGHARLGDAQFVDQTVKDSWFCIEGECACPAGTEGSPPAAPTLKRPAILGLTAGTAAAKGSVTYHSLDEFCKLKQQPPPEQCVGDGHARRTAARHRASDRCPPGKHPEPVPASDQPGSHKQEDPPDPVACTGHGCAHSAADPHLLPFGGNWYDFQGVGEYTLVRSLSGDLEVQVRQRPWPGSKVVSMNTAAAMRVAGDRVTVDHGQPLTVRVNGRPVLLQQKDVPLAHGGKLRPLRQGQLDVVWPDGTVVRIIPPTGSSIDIVVSLAPSRLGKVTGLLGDNDGITADDFRTRGGKRLDPAKVRGASRAAYRLLYRVFGDSWRVTQKTSLFDYAPGQSTRTFTDRRFPARVATTATLSPAARRKAEQVCRGLGLTKPRVLDACILDVAQTGSYGFATAIAVSQLATKKGKAKPPPPPPASKGLSATVKFQGKRLTYKGTKQDEGCRFTFPGVAFRILIGAYSDPEHPAFVLAVVGGKKDGTYASGASIVFQATIAGKEVLVGVDNPTVTLAGLRTRGTFKGTASTPGKDPVSGSFSC
jgi:hypothetical protein